MEQKVIRISGRQFMLAVLMFVTGSSILLVPTGLILAAKQDAWIAAAVGTVGGLGLSFVYLKLAKMHPRKSLFQFSEDIFGKWFGRAVNILYILYAFILSAEVLSNLGDFITTQIMVETPKKYIHLLFLIPVCYGVGLGIETISRSMEAILPSLLIMFFGLLVLLLPQIEPSQIQPIFGEGLKAILNGSLVVINVPYLEMILLLGLFQYMNQEEKVTKVFMTGVFLGGITLIIIPLLIVIILGNNFAGMLLYPGYSVARMVDIGQFLQRVEVVFAAIWICTLFYKLVICFYVSLKGLNHVLGLQDGRLLLFPLILILWLLSIIIYPNFAFFQTVIGSILSYNLFFGLFLPLLMIVVSMMKKKKNGEQSESA